MSMHATQLNDIKYNILTRQCIRKKCVGDIEDCYTSSSVAKRPKNPPSFYPTEKKDGIEYCETSISISISVFVELCVAKLKRAVWAWTRIFALMKSEHANQVSRSTDNRQLNQ